MNHKEFQSKNNSSMTGQKSQIHIRKIQLHVFPFQGTREDMQIKQIQKFYQQPGVVPFIRQMSIKRVKWPCKTDFLIFWLVDFSYIFEFFSPSLSFWWEMKYWSSGETDRSTLLHFSNSLSTWKDGSVVKSTQSQILFPAFSVIVGG